MITLLITITIAVPTPPCTITMRTMLTMLTVIPALLAKRETSGSSAYEASAGASSVCVHMIVCAVDAGVACRVDDRTDQLEVVTPTEDDTFAASALAAVLAPPARYVFEDYGQPDVDGKLGIGGSAAATVAGCLAGFEGPVETDTLHTIAATLTMKKSRRLCRRG